MIYNGDKYRIFSVYHSIGDGGTCVSFLVAIAGVMVDSVIPAGAMKGDTQLPVCMITWLYYIICPDYR
ncbi:hypothetical protein CK934_28720 [Chitinophaga sp. MD30]|nr:hypothetical protein CK934_28720 [Chitinophaga sp. MD30]